VDEGTGAPGSHTRGLTRRRELSEIDPGSEIIRPERVHEPLGAYSHAVRYRASGLLFLAGQVAVGGEGEIVGPGDCAAQTRQAYVNVERILAAAGSSLGGVVRFRSYLVSAEDIPAYREARSEVFAMAYPDGDYPAHTLLVVAGLAAPELLVEIEADALAAGA
jgi:2-iminobutanoate/2-iminopropanoate deaminase